MAQNHTYFYKILDSPPPDPLPETLPLSDLDKKDGFIHLSTAKQTPVTMNLFFSNSSKLWVLKLRVTDLDGQIRVPDDLPGCPHVHNTVKGLGRGNVESVIEVEKSMKGDWRDVEALKALEE